MINILTGLPGSGKTYILTRKALEFAYEGRKLYSNFRLVTEKGSLFYPFRKQITYWETADELIKIEKGVILMDEAQVYFNSRRWNDLDIRLQYKLQQHRKDGLDIWGTVQSETRIDPVMRELVTQYYLCHKLFGSKEAAKFVFGLIKVGVYYPEDIKRVTSTHVFSEWYYIRKRFVKLYDTNTKISLEDKVRPMKHVEYECPKCGEKKTSHKT